MSSEWKSQKSKTVSAELGEDSLFQGSAGLVKRKSKGKGPESQKSERGRGE